MGSIWWIVRCGSKCFACHVGGVKVAGMRPMLMVGYRVCKFIASPKGQDTQRRVFEQLMKKLEGIQSGIMENLSSSPNT